jgi:D-alanyl-D-alanine carboxypeptidase
MAPPAPAFAILLAFPAPMALAVPQAALTPGRNDMASRVATLVRPVLDEIVARGAPGVTAALVLPDGTEVAICAGFADVEARRAMRPSDRLLSGSVGKTYVAAAALQLVARGELRLDAPLAAHFAGEAWFDALANAEDLTLRHLLRHQSGLARYEFEPRFWEALVAEPDRVWRPEEQLAFLAGRPALARAGEGFTYSDSNYLLVGLLLERITGRPIREHVAEHVLRPAGLLDTVPSDSRRIPGLTQGYCRALAGLGLPERMLVDGEFVIHPGFEGCGGGYASTPLDLARWTRRFASGGAFAAAVHAEFLDGVPAAAELGRGARYGLGVILHDTALGEARGHEGIMTGFLAATAWFPAHDITVAVQVNTDDGRVFGRPLKVLVADLAARALDAARPPTRR